jgi:hypothetical protein
MAAHRDDPLRTQLRRGEDTREADGAVAHDHDGAPGLDVRADGRVPAGAHHIGERQDARHHRPLRLLRRGDERPVGILDTDQLGLAAVVPRAVLAVGVRAGLAQGAGVVAREEPTDDELPGLHRGDIVADRLDDADVLVPDRRRLRHVRDAAVAPQVRTAHARRHGADDGVGGLDDGRIGPVL